MGKTIHIYIHGAQPTRDAGFDESKHPRNHGKFAAGGGAAAAAAKTPAKGSSHPRQHEANQHLNKWFNGPDHEWGSKTALVDKLSKKLNVSRAHAAQMHTAWASSQAPTKDAKHDVSPLVAALLEAIAARQGKTGDAGEFDESKHKRDEGGRFAAHGGSAMKAAEHHEKMAGKHHQAAMKEPSVHTEAYVAHKKAAQLHHNASETAKTHLTHGLPYKHYEEASNAAASASEALGASKAPAAASGAHAAAAQALNGKEFGNTIAQARVGPDGTLHADWDLTFRRNTAVGAFNENRADIARMNEHMAQQAKKLGVEYKPYTIEDAKKSDAFRERGGGSAYSEYEQSIGHGFTAKPQAAAQPEPPAAKAPAASSAAANAPSTGKPTKATASGAKAATHELLSSGHPFTVDELMSATGCSNKTTLMTAISDLKSPKYAGKLGALSIKKNADGTFQIEKKEGGRPDGLDRPSGPLPARVGPDGKDIGSAQNTQARIDAKAAAAAPAIPGRGKAANRGEVATAETLKEHPQYNKEDHDYLAGKGWKPDEIKRRWDQEHAAGQAPATGKVKAPDVTGVVGNPNFYKKDNSNAKYYELADATAAHKKTQTSNAKTAQVQSKNPDAPVRKPSPSTGAVPSHMLTTPTAKPATSAQLTAAKNKIGSIEMQIEKLQMKGVGRSDGRLFDLRQKLENARLAHTRLERTAKPTSTAPVNASTKTPLHNALEKAAGSYGGATGITPEQIAAAAKYMEGKRNVDILKMADTLGIKDGQAKHLNEARKAHFAAQGSGRSATQAERIGNYLKQTHIGLIKR